MENNLNTKDLFIDFMANINFSNKEDIQMFKKLVYQLFSEKLQLFGRYYADAYKNENGTVGVGTRNNTEWIKEKQGILHSHLDHTTGTGKTRTKDIADGRRRA